MTRLLIIDDDVQLCKALSLVIERMGFEVRCAYTLEQGFALLERQDFQVVILDIRLPDGNGLEALPRIRESANDPEVIILSGTGDPDGAELAIRSGAWSYITKPPTLSKIQLPVQRAVEYWTKKQGSRPLRLLERGAIVGESRAILHCLKIVAQAADSDCNVLISGETGTGKELFARAIHANSARAKRPFVVVDCGALPGNLVESILFGHEKGAFTGADRSTQGLLSQASGGTLFLDEVGELPMSIQKAFLRVLQNRSYRPVGGLREQTSDFRLVAATNRNLEELVQTWAFRQDLLFRLRTIGIELPPLRERKGDAKRIACHWLQQRAQQDQTPTKAFAPELFEALEEYRWPGNVRELINALEHALTASRGETILSPRHLPVEIRAQLARNLLEERTPGVTGDPAPAPTEPLRPLQEHRNAALERLEREYLTRLMQESGGDIRRACSIAGLSRQRLYALLKQYGIAREQVPGSKV